MIPFREQTYEISSHFLSYSKLVLLEGLSKKSVRNKESMLEEVLDAKKRVSEMPLFGGQDRLKKAYLNYYIAMETYLRRLPVMQIRSVEFFDTDSARKFQEVQVRELVLLADAAGSLKLDFDKFCIVNKVKGQSTSGALFARQKEAVPLISYAVKIKNAVMDIRRLNRLFFVSLLEDTGNKAEVVRKELLKQSAVGRASLLAVPAFPGERKLRKSGLNNVRLYGISAGKVYKDLVAFRIKELAFIQMSIDFKERRHNTDFEADAYYQEVRRFSELIKENRKEVKVLNQTRVSLERSFDDFFLEFIEGRFDLSDLSKPMMPVAGKGKTTQLPEKHRKSGTLSREAKMG